MAPAHCGRAEPDPYAVMTELFQRCRSRVSTVAVMDDIGFGPHRALRKFRQDFGQATP